MSDFNFQVDLKGLIRLLSDNLYSDDNVFLRELLQNSVDAIAARTYKTPDFNQGKIIVRSIKTLDGTIMEFQDNGIGLTEEEIHTFLSIKVWSKRFILE